MRILGHLTIIPELPAPLAGLEKLAQNLWWTWNSEAQALFADLDPELWHKLRGNPVRMLLEVEPARLNELAHDGAYLERLEACLSSLEAYLARPRRVAGGTVAYFSMEFGLHESLPFYSGGLGVLAGDFLKAASDLGVQMFGVGIYYHQGYFRQQIDSEGRQVEFYEELKVEELPVKPLLDRSGNKVMVNVGFPGRAVHLCAYQLLVGRAHLLLLSADLPENSPEDRAITARLYAPGQEMRIQQEMLLGIGGVRVLRAAGIEPAVWHMNEGHSAFQALERIRELVEQKLPFAAALEAAAAGGLFTTHTPVPAGHDAFPLELMDRYLGWLYPKLGISRDEFLALGWEQRPWGPVFSMSNLSLATSHQANGVSKIHGRVSRDMFAHLWPGLEAEEVPIGEVTNGAHVASYLNPELRDLYARSFPSEWLTDPIDPANWAVENIDKSALCIIKARLREKLVGEARRRVYQARRRAGAPPWRLRQAERVLNPEALTIGFARRFATYKRAMLLFTDPERLTEIVRGVFPVQFIFAGKAHPQDEPGKGFLAQVYKKIEELNLEDRIVVVEDYDLELARYLVQGVDIWLNNPMRPLEASGTSGMKAAFNAGINLSVLDGWWAEAYNGKNGWAIGDSELSLVQAPEETQNTQDAHSLYDLLQNQILPLYHSRGVQGYPNEWVQIMLESVRSVGPVFSAQRMVRDYGHKYYVPAAQLQRDMSADSFALARRVGEWRSLLKSCWPEVQVQAEVAGDPHTVKVRAWVKAPVEIQNFLRPEVVLRRSSGKLETFALKPVSSEAQLIFSGTYRPSRPGSYTYGVRVVALNPELGPNQEIDFVRWG